MAYYHTVKIKQKTKSGIRTVTLGKNISAFKEPGKAQALIMKAAAMPATMRIEVEETDTQLYAFPANERVYLSMVIMPKDGRLFRYFGKGATAAYLDTSVDARQPLYTLRLS